jgi:hypothetical protein
MPFDTSPAARDIQCSILKRMSGTERLRIAIALSEFARNLAFARILGEHPGITKPRLIREFLRCVLSGEDHPHISA